jgi:type II secretory pathway component GspD/PulD (secretin)
MMKNRGARGAFGLWVVGFAALVLALGTSARAGEAPADDTPAPEEDVPVVVPPMPAPAPEVAEDEPAPEPEDAPAPGPGPEDAPPIEDEDILDIWGAQPERPPAWVEQTIARDVKVRQKYVRACRAEAIKALRTQRYEVAIKVCDRALAVDPENLAIERLRALARRQLQEYRLLVEAERSLAADEETLATVSLESRFPADKPAVERPKLLLREDMPESEGMRRMDELLNQRVSMNFVEADLDYVLQTLFKISNVNIIADQSIVADKTLSLHVENVPLSTILNFIKRNYEGIDYTATEHAVLLTTPESPPLVPRAYPLSRGLIGKGSGSSGVRRSGGQTNSGGSIGGRSGSNARGTSGGGGGGESYIETVLAWVETWENEWPQGSQWYLDRKTTTLIVLTTPEMHKRIGEILDIIDVVPIQILVRAKFLEVDSNDLAEAGLGLTYVDNEALDYRLQTPGSNPAEYTYPIRDAWKAQQMPTKLEHGAMGFGKIFGMSGGEIFAKLTLLQEKKRSKMLSAPQMLALNNQLATIDISKSFSYATQYTSSQTSVIASSTGVPAGDIAAAFVPSSYEELTAGFFMEFTPSVGRDMKTITLDLHVRIDQVKNIDQFESSPVIMAESGATPPSIPRPVIDGREFSTQMVIEDGNAVVIGGLLTNHTEIIQRKVPILGDIPILGIPFRYRKKVTRQSNLIIVIQAQIVRPDGSHYADKRGPQTIPPEYGMQSFGSGPKRTEWIRDLPPGLESDILRGAGR